MAFSGLRSPNRVTRDHPSSKDKAPLGPHLQRCPWSSSSEANVSSHLMKPCRTLAIKPSKEIPAIIYSSSYPISVIFNDSSMILSRLISPATDSLPALPLTMTWETPSRSGRNWPEAIAVLFQTDRVKRLNLTWWSRSWQPKLIRAKTLTKSSLSQVPRLKRSFRWSVSWPRSSVWMAQSLFLIRTKSLMSWS